MDPGGKITEMLLLGIRELYRGLKV